MLIAAIAEVLSLGTLLPFLGVLTSPEKILSHDLLQPLIHALLIESAEALILLCTVAFVLATLIAGFARVALLWMQTRLSMAISADLSVQVYERSLYQPYSVHIMRNSSTILVGVGKASNLVTSMIQPLMTILSSILILVAVIMTLFVIEPIIALAAFLGFGLIYSLVVALTKHRIIKNSQTIANQQVRVAKVIQEGLGGIRDVILDGAQPLYSKLYKESFIPVQLAIASNQVVAASPRFAVESLSIVLIAALAYVMIVSSAITGVEHNAIPVLGALALSAQRLLPVCQQLYNAYITIKGNQASSQDSLDLLDQPAPNHDRFSPARTMIFQRVITLKNIGFRYSPQGSWVLRNINLEIPKGSRIGFIGATGSGKSTLLDIVMGLLRPIEGQVLIDNIVVNEQNTRSWQAQIAHVPQAIYLSDTSVAENIAFGVSAGQVDFQRVAQAAEQAQIAKTITGWPDGYGTLIGERGVRLSGGQRQRIGIARALYKHANVIIFDEATSALDHETEATVMQAIETLGRDITILIIAHRLSTLKNCDQIVRLGMGGIRSSGTYEELVSNTL